MRSQHYWNVEGVGMICQGGGGDQQTEKSLMTEIIAHCHYVSWKMGAGLRDCLLLYGESVHQQVTPTPLKNSICQLFSPGIHTII